MDPAWSYLFLLIGSFFAATISGTAGFGGALLLLPLLSMTLGTDMAVPILTIAQLIGNLSRAAFGYKEIKWKPAGLFMLGAVPMSAIGAFSFAQMPTGILTRIIGLGIIAFAVLTYFKIWTFTPGSKTMLFGGMLVGLLSGLIGSAGPIGAAIFLSLNLTPVSYVASEAVTAVAMHLSKTIVYQRFLGIGFQAFLIGLLMGAAMIAGTWAGKKIIEKLPGETFRKVIGVLLVLVGMEMVIFG